MKLSIWKFPVPVRDEFTVSMPTGARLLSVQVQGDIGPQLWALCSPDAELVTRKLAVRGTGHGCDNLNDSAFVGTFQLHGGGLVFHLFDRGE